jgi:hypothetical protein
MMIMFLFLALPEMVADAVVLPEMLRDEDVVAEDPLVDQRLMSMSRKL